MSGLVSVVLPTYNGEKYLREAVESVLGQTCRDIELIIVDDCSNDSTAQIAAGFAAADNRVKVISNSANRKLPASLNIGFAAAKGQWLTWTSDDNLYFPEAIAGMLNVLESGAADIVYCDYETDDLRTGKRGIRVVPDDVCHLVHSNNIGACFLYRRSVHDELGGYDENLFGAEDYDFWMRALLRFRFKALHEVLYHYRFHEASLTSTRAEMVRNAVACARKKLFCSLAELDSRSCEHGGAEVLSRLCMQEKCGSVAHLAQCSELLEKIKTARCFDGLCPDAALAELFYSVWRKNVHLGIGGLLFMLRSPWVACLRGGFCRVSGGYVVCFLHGMRSGFGKSV